MVSHDKLELKYINVLLWWGGWGVWEGRALHTDFGMGGGYQSPPIGGPKGGDKGPMGGDWRVIRDKIKGTNTTM